ncbi:hypothetical protein K461DRAFT_182985 [Myriangium duriaei CBS 260.36]|uniref:Uncharacterized protein n=1 Tax=Myriangium duriaei CBS 260.36 TaxID=1168546 RepID=A0A9P4IY69_9PEZI|nr:hypothetical protein K461DRAFT_182985 [Myriangium duriaei CBS 260.36]
MVSRLYRTCPRSQFELLSYFQVSSFSPHWFARRPQLSINYPFDSSLHHQDAPSPLCPHLYPRSTCHSRSLSSSPAVSTAAQQFIHNSRHDGRQPQLPKRDSAQILPQLQSEAQASSNHLVRLLLGRSTQRHSPNMLCDSEREKARAPLHAGHRLGVDRRHAPAGCPAQPLGGRTSRWVEVLVRRFSLRSLHEGHNGLLGGGVDEAQD